MAIDYIGVDLDARFTQEIKPRDSRPVAVVLALVAGSKFYDYTTARGEGMCWALTLLARQDGLITGDELEFVGEQVGNYVFDLAPERVACYLREALHLNGLPSNEKACRAIYLDWNNRPGKPALPTFI